jgi:hypothetical protein
MFVSQVIKRTAFRPHVSARRRSKRTDIHRLRAHTSFAILIAVLPGAG